jgi:hypothetical protein
MCVHITPAEIIRGVGNVSFECSWNLYASNIIQVYEKVSSFLNLLIGNPSNLFIVLSIRPSCPRSEVSYAGRAVQRAEVFTGRDVYFTGRVVHGPGCAGSGLSTVRVVPLLIGPPHSPVCRKRRQNGAVFWARPENRSRSDTIKIPPFSKALSVEHRPQFCSPSSLMVTSPYSSNRKIIEQYVKP